MRAFVGIDLGQEPVPDETTVCKFRHLLEEHGLGRALFEEVNRHLQTRGLTISTGTIVDATIIAAPSSTKNATGTRDPEMHQTKKGQQWYFGMKGHFGVDSQTKLIHSVEATPANVHDNHVLPFLLHGRERRVWGDAAYCGQAAVLRACAPHAQDFTQRPARMLAAERATNRRKSRVRAKVEHPIGVIKRLFRFTKVCYRGLRKNRDRLVVACALTNLFMARHHLLRWQAV
jgi:IS5 family transposase